MKTKIGMLMLLAAMAGCDGDRPDVDLGGRDIGPDLFSVLSTDGGVRMALTDDYVYLALSDSGREQALEGMSEAREQEGAAGVIAGFVEQGVDRALGFRTLLPLDEIEELRWENGEMRMVFSDGQRTLDDIIIGDEPVTRTFSEEAVREFAEELRALKGEHAARSG